MPATRFAPSLTGYLHLGHVLHLMYVHGVAKKTDATVLFRIEDHDVGRARPEYESAILADMDWLGFIPEAGCLPAFRQSDCDEYYTSVLQELLDRGLVYGCECSRKEIAVDQSDHAQELCYYGHCVEKGLSLEGNTVRFRVPSGAIGFDDLRLGECRQTPRDQCGDFSLRDRNGQWTYQFCCVCDDIRQGIDLVIRGEDILSSTARQIQLFEALGAPVPRFYHHPLLHDEHGDKLSKRQHAESIAQLRESGMAAEEVIGRAAFSAGLISEFRPVDFSEVGGLIG